MKNFNFSIIAVFIFCVLPFSDFAQSAKKLWEAGEKLEKTQNYAEAIENYNKAIEADANYYKAYASRGYCNQKLNKFDLAMADYNKAIMINDKDKQLLTKVGSALAEANKLSEADHMLRMALEIDRTYVEAIEAEITVLTKLKDFATGLNYTQLALDVKINANNYYRHAVFHDSLNHPEEAEKYYRNAKEHDSKFMPAYIALAYTDLKLGKLDEAKNNIDYILGKDPFNSDALFARSVYNAGKNSFQAAIEDISKVIMATPTNNKALIQRGSYFEALGEFQNANADYSQAIKNSPKNVEAYLKRASCYEQTRDVRTAIADYNKVLQIAGNTPAVQAMIKQAKSKAYELNRETVKPEVEILSAKTEKNGIKVAADKKDFIIRGRVKDNSQIIQITASVGKVIFSSDSLNPEFILKVSDGSKLNDITIYATDNYNNTCASKYAIERTESDKPIIAIETPYTSFENEMSIDIAGNNLYIQGKIKDASLIEAIVIDGINASFSPSSINPEFSAQINITDKDKLKMMVRDIYGNETVTTYNLNRSGAMAGLDNPMGNTWVIFIENSKYVNFPSLEGPAKDVLAMKAALANYKITQIVHEKDMTKLAMDKFFSIKLRDYVKNNNINSLVIWYAGHGKYVSPTGYWVPSDGKPDDEFSYFGINNLKAAMQSYAGKLVHTLVITDACESGATFLMAMRGGADGQKCDNFELTKAKSSQVFTSAGFELASDNSQFTKSFVSALNTNVEPCLPIEKIVKKVTAAVAAAGNQAPKFGKIKDLEDEGGTFFFIKK